MALIAKQLGAHEIFICNTSNIDSMRHGRPQTVLIEQGMDLHNGAIVELLDTKETQANPELDHVHGIKLDAAGQTSVVGKFIIVDPEINVEQYRRIDSSLAQFGTKPLEQNATHTAYELQKLDRIEYSLAYFEGVQGVITAAEEQAELAGTDPVAAAQQAVETFVGTITPGTKCNINDKGELKTGGEALRVVSVRKQRIPLMMDANRNHLPEAYYMIKLEVIK